MQGSTCTIGFTTPLTSNEKEKESIMLTIIFLLLALVLLNLAAWRWGFDSRDGIDSPEWERRRN